MKKIIGLLLISLPLLAQVELPAAAPELPPLNSAELAKPPTPKAKKAKFKSPTKTYEDEVARVVPVMCKRPKGKFQWNVDKAKFSDVVEQISSLTCKSYLYSAAIKPTQEITILNKTEITVDQAENVFLAMLETYELAVVKSGEFYKIVRRNDAIRQPIPIIDDPNELPRSEAMVTYLHELKHVSKDVASNLAKGMVSRLGNIDVFGDTLLVISDGSSNIRRIEKILTKIDVASAANRIHVVDLAYAEAKTVTETLNKIFDSKGASVEKSRYMSASERAALIQSGKSDDGGDGFSVQKIIPEERTNKLIVIASDKGYERVKEMIDTLDVPSSKISGQIQINVYYLKNGDATKMAATLSTLTQSLKSGRNQNPSMGNPFGPNLETFEGDIKINADAATNSLVIAANPRDFKALSAVIAKLDKERIQVYVEAAIFDIGLTDTLNLGINAYGAFDTGMGIGLLANPGGRDLANGVVGAIGKAAAAGTSLQAAGGAALASFVNTVGFMGPMKDLFGIGVKLPGIGVVLDTLQTFSNVDVLSTPSLMTLDNEKAEISVGEKIPVVKGASQIGLGTGGAGIPIQNVEMMEVKLKFGITPHVNPENQVRLEIDQDVNELGEKVTVLGATQYIVRTKTAKTTVVAKDQQTIVIGGLIDQRNVSTESKIPILGDIPIIGYLFKKTERTKVKKNLLLVLTPYVVRSDADLQNIHARKMKEREDFGKLYFGDKITKFDPAIDFDKKTGPLTRLINQVDQELKRVENGGPGMPGDTVVVPDKPERKEKIMESTLPVEETNEAPSPAPETIAPTIIDDSANLPGVPVPISSEPAPPAAP